MLEKGPLTALLGGIDLLSHQSLQENKKVSISFKKANQLTFQQLEYQGKINCHGPDLCVVWPI